MANTSKNLKIIETDNKFSYTQAISGDFFVPFSQSWSYGKWQKASGRGVRNYVISCGKEVLGGFQLISYSLPLELSYLYIPHGPILKRKLSKVLETELLDFLKILAIKERVIFIRIDSWPETLNDQFSKDWESAPLYSYHGAYTQPRFEWVLNLASNEEYLLSKMHPHCRYNIKLAEKKGVKITKITEEKLSDYFETFYNLLLETAKRNGFHLHPKSYYANLFKESSDKIELFLAEYNGEYLAADLIYYGGNVANWLFGGSSNNYRNLGPTFLLQWHSILSAKEKGYKYYSFGGVYNADYPNVYKGYKNITFYKKNYGGFYLNYNPSYIYSPRPFLNWLYNIRRQLKNILL
ncbi:MAG: peptidoglycan bridge formation glycyltransferase FemA/FemB family protein [Candidatus Parcubacteria bacterium]|nr:peptidoglycan bridge formation glycyltransferase FemA/FemB family protein [Candidatus Parcubacteria bacterium]